MPEPHKIPGAPPSPTPAPRAREILAAIATAALGFLFAAGALHAAIVAKTGDPLRLHADVRSEKLVMLDRWQGNVFSAAFGSSHVHNAFDPRAFDAALANTRLATRSANLAIEGGSQSEQAVMAREFLARLPSPPQPQPCFVLLELDAGVNFTSDHLVHPRSINIYDWPTTRLTTRFLTPGMSSTQRIGRVGYALAAMGLHYLNVGMLSNAIFTPPLNQEILSGQTADDRRGQLVEAPRATPLPYMTRLVSSAPPTPGLSKPEISPGSLSLISDLASVAPARNPAFVFIVMPRLGDLTSAVDYPDHLSAAGRDVPIINLARPDRFPELYHIELFHDDAHLTGAGAQIASTLLARQLQLWYATHGAPPQC